MEKVECPNGLQMKYFVLKPRGDDRYAEASRFAMRAYASSIRNENPELAKELISWVEHEKQLAPAKE